MIPFLCEKYELICTGSSNENNPHDEATVLFCYWLQTDKSVQPAEDVFEEDRSFAVVVAGFYVQKHDHYYQNCPANTAPEDYLRAPETIDACYWSTDSELNADPLVQNKCRYILHYKLFIVI